MMTPTLRFDIGDIGEIARRYQYPLSETELLALLKPRINDRGYMTKEELAEVAYWKAPRSARHVKRNAEEYVVEVTRFAFGTACERARIQSLTMLDGVLWPTASVILHLFHREPYQILDFRALWSVSLDIPAQYSFGYWWPYVQFCRELAESTGMDMRTLDRALWQYSKENQREAQQVGAG